VISEENVEIDNELIPPQKGAIKLYPYFDEQELVDIWMQVVKGIIELHKQNIVHLNIRPSNIIITDRESTKVCLKYFNKHNLEI
jgi:serine/threonine protein kinase